LLQTPLTSSSCIAHCFSFLGLFHRQKNHGTEEEQERVMLEPSGTTVEECGELEMIWMLETGVDDDMMEMITRSSNVIVTVKEASTEEALILS